MKEDKKNNSGKDDILPTASRFTQQEQVVFAAPTPRIPGYRIIRNLGEGGMGIIYLADQVEPVKRRVAIKVIKPGMDSKQVIARFEAEQQALALLNHRGIAKVYSAGTTETGRPYFVMEYVKGIALTDHCEHYRLNIEERLKLFIQVCDAIQHAHQKGIIHRDIKPSNILVSIENEQPILKVIDFGIAKAISTQLTEHTLYTRQGQMIGTPDYMSPEQAEITNQDIDTRSDIYSLGVVLYELLTGVLPFDSKKLREAPLGKLQKIIEQTDPPRPSARLSSLGEQAKEVAHKRKTDASSLARRLQKELEWIPLKAIRKERTHRYRSASEFADDIQNYLNGAPLIAGPESVSYQVKKFVNRNRMLVTCLSAVLFVIILGAITTTIFAVREHRARSIAEIARASEAQQRRIAEIARKEAEEEAKISQAINDFLSNDLLASLNPFETQGRRLTIWEVLNTASEDLEGRFQDTPLVEASIRATLGTAYLRLGDYTAAEPHLKLAYEIRCKQLGEEHVDTLDSMIHLAMLYREQRRFTEAEPFFLKSLVLCRRVFGEEHPETLSSMEQLAWYYLHQERYAEAEPLLVKQLEIKRRVLGEEHLETLESEQLLAVLHQEQGRFAEAEPVLLKSLQVHLRIFGEEHPSTLHSMQQLAYFYRKQERNAEAEPIFLKVLEIGRRMMGDEHPETTQNVINLAVLYREQGRFTEAESILAEALDIQRRQSGEEHPLTLDVMEHLAGTYAKQQRYAEAEAMLVKVLDQRRKLGENHPNTLHVKSSLINLYESWGKPEKAEQWRSKLSDKEGTENQ